MINGNNKTDIDMKARHLNFDEFATRVANPHNLNDWQFLGDKPAIVDFYASWCGPCKMLMPVLEEIESEVSIIKINVDIHPDIASDYKVMSIPTLFYVKDGESVTLPANTFTNGLSTFVGWNTAANGSGTAYADKGTVKPTANITLYAQWEAPKDTGIADGHEWVDLGLSVLWSTESMEGKYMWMDDVAYPQDMNNPHLKDYQDTIYADPLYIEDAYDRCMNDAWTEEY